MQAHDPNQSSLATPGPAELQRPPLTSTGAGDSDAGGAVSADDVHLAELVRSLRSLAGDSPEWQARMEQMARSVASGSFRVDAQGTASKIVSDALQRP
ncbi:MAG TPA: hypothetical protein VN841_11170 [Bryobacteraceae bacterium]|nr:hypothetical protein [Bryobacteraceae bacterium]